MDRDFKSNLIKQALWFLRKALEILERLIGHPHNKSIADTDPTISVKELDSEPDRGSEPAPKAAGTSIYEHGLDGNPNHRSHRNGRPRLQRAARDAFCRLKIDGYIGVMQVIACQASSGHGTIRDRKRHAEATISKIKGATRGLGITIRKKEKGWGCYEWILTRDDPKHAQTSVDKAYEIALQAQYNFDTGNYPEAMELAIQAVVTDDIVQLGHEILCLATTEIVPAEQVNMDRVRASRRVLANRIDQISHGQQIAGNSLSDADDEGLRAHLMEAEVDFAAERERVSGILTGLDNRFGALNVRMSLPDREAHETIVALRKGGIGLEEVEKQRLRNSILVHPAVSRIFENIEQKCANCDPAKRDEFRNRAKGILQALCTDPNIPANIRLICSRTDQALKDSLRSPRARCAEARNYKRMEAAREECYKEHGRRPSDEEIADLTGLTMEQIRAALDWRRIDHPLPPGAENWQKPKRKPKIEDAENYGLDDDHDDPLTGELVG